ncbi:MAG: hypothetical protein WBD10_13810 [Acidobacteriaceae bacterium]
MTQRATQYTTAPLPNSRAALPWWACLVAILGAFLLAAGAAIALVHPALLVSPNASINQAVHIYAGYLASRNLAIAILLVALLALRARFALSNLLALVAFVQILDAIIDAVEGRWPIVPGILVLGLVFLLAAGRLSGYPFWKSAAWQPPPGMDAPEERAAPQQD